MTYVSAVHASGGRAVLITPDDPDIDVLESLDGIVFSGGGDVDPAHWGAAQHPATEVDQVRDTAELMLMKAALAADLPILGVCRGMQVMAVATGGTLHQHLPDIVGHDRHRAAAGTDPLAADASAYGRHDVVIRPVPGRRPCSARTWWSTPSTTRRWTTRASSRPSAGAPTTASSRSSRIRPATFAMGVQWHPERTTDLRVFAALVQAAAARSGLDAARNLAA